MQGFRSFLERSLLFVNDFLKKKNNAAVERLIKKITSCLCGRRIQATHPLQTNHL